MHRATNISGLLVVVALLAGCRLFSSSNLEASLAEVTESDAAERQKNKFRIQEEAAHARECPPLEGLCTASDSPVFCQVRTYAGKAIKFHEQFSTHAASACHARTQIYKLACQDRMAPSLLGSVQCVPDGSSGHCPVEERDCGELQPEHTVCRVVRYSDQVLKGHPGMFARGASECDARNQLNRLVCRNNLNPKLVQDIRCEIDETGGECLNVKHVCDDERKKTWCRVTLLRSKASSEDIETLEVEGESRCDAMMMIHRKACDRQLKPSMLEQITCRFEK